MNTHLPEPETYNRPPPPARTQSKTGRFYGRVTTAVAAGLAALSLAGCSREPTPAEIDAYIKGPSAVPKGEGVYVMKFDDNLGSALALFKKQNTNLVITAVYANDESGHGMTYNVVIVTEPRALFGAKAPPLLTK